MEKEMLPAEVVKNEIVKNEIVKKSNTLIMSLQKPSLLSSKVMLLSLLNLEDRDNKKYTPAEIEHYAHIENRVRTDFTKGLVSEIPNSELRRMLGIQNSGSYYQKIKLLMDNAYTNRHSLRNNWQLMMPPHGDDDVYGYTELITGSAYDNKRGVLLIKFSQEPAVRKEIYNLQTNFTSLDTEVMCAFKSVYSYRIYEMLQSRVDYDMAVCAKKGSAIPTVFEYTYEYGQLKFLIGALNPFEHSETAQLLKSKSPNFNSVAENLTEVLMESDDPDKGMPRWADFKRYSLDRAKKEINELSRKIRIDFKPIKNGRGGKVTHVKFITQRIVKEQEASPAKTTSRKTSVREVGGDAFDTYFEAVNNYLRMISPDRRIDIKPTEIITIYSSTEADENQFIQKYEMLLKQSKPVSNVVGWLISAINDDYDEPKEYIPKEAKSKNQFNNFEQNTYDYEDLLNKIRVN